MDTTLETICWTTALAVLAIVAFYFVVKPVPERLSLWRSERQRKKGNVLWVRLDAWEWFETYTLDGNIAWDRRAGESAWIVRGSEEERRFRQKHTYHEEDEQGFAHDGSASEGQEEWLPPGRRPV